MTEKQDDLSEVALSILAHKLEIEYGLTAEELLNALDKRFRAKVTLEGAVAEVQMEKHIRALRGAGIVERYEEHDGSLSLERRHNSV